MGIRAWVLIGAVTVILLVITVTLLSGINREDNTTRNILDAGYGTKEAKEDTSDMEGIKLDDGTIIRLVGEDNRVLVILSDGSRIGVNPGSSVTVGDGINIGPSEDGVMVVTLLDGRVIEIKTENYTWRAN